MVAGCVGLMMCDVLSIKDSLARYYAIDLGIAMQLTNISRDVVEDLEMNRIYIPKTMRSYKNNNDSYSWIR